MNSMQASATIFGFQFQINAAIYLMLKYFSDFNQIKIEGSQEDIELFLHDNKKIYAQAKSKEFPTKDNKGHSEKLKDALRTLSDVDDRGNYDLMYISNLEENPLNSGTKEFDGISFLKYDELKEESKKKLITKYQTKIIILIQVDWLLLKYHSMVMIGNKDIKK